MFKLKTATNKLNSNAFDQTKSHQYIFFLTYTTFICPSNLFYQSVIAAINVFYLRNNVRMVNEKDKKPCHMKKLIQHNTYPKTRPNPKLQMWTKPCSQKPSEMKLFQNNFQTETILHAHDLSPLTPEPYTRQL